MRIAALKEILRATGAEPGRTLHLSTPGGPVVGAWSWLRGEQTGILALRRGATTWHVHVDQVVGVGVPDAAEAK